MRGKFAWALAAASIGVLIGTQFTSRTEAVEAGAPGAGFASTPGAIGGQDIFGAYDVVKGWPKDISTVAGNEKWTYGAGQGVYAESPNRIYGLFRGELPNIKRPETKLVPEFGASVQFPIGRLPYRDATVSSPPAPAAPARIPRTA